LRNFFASYLLEKARLDSRILLVTGDLGFGVLDEFATALPNQYMNIGITEQSSMSVCAGLSAEGFRPFYYSIANFPTFRCLEQIRVDVNYMVNPVTIVSVGAGFAYSSHGYTHHAVEDLAVMRSLGNIRIFSPTFADSIHNSINTILKHNLPAYLRLGAAVVESDKSEIERHNESLTRTDLVICFTGSVPKKALELARLAYNHGIHALIVSIDFLCDEEVLKVLKIESELNLLVTIEEHSITGGLGTLLLEVSSRSNSSNKVLCFGIERTIIDKAYDREHLLLESGLDMKKALGRILERI